MSDPIGERQCYCPEDGVHPVHLREAGVPPGFCGMCEVCKLPGHACHYPGALPYTGSWCNAHYTLLVERMEAALEPGAAYGLRNADVRHFRVRGRVRRKWLFRRYAQPDVLLEFRSNWLARYVVADAGTKSFQHHERWDHPLSVWKLPLDLMRQPDWQELRPEDFESAWASGRRPGGAA